VGKVVGAEVRMSEPVKQYAWARTSGLRKLDGTGGGMLADGLKVGLDHVGILEGTAVGMLVDGLKVGLGDVELLEGTAGRVRANGLTVGLDEVRIRVDCTEDMGVVVGSAQKSGETKWDTQWALMSMAWSKEMMKAPRMKAKPRDATWSELSCARKPGLRTWAEHSWARTSGLMRSVKQ
jgi:hypothetical protein